MKILVTGAGGFIGKNLITSLISSGYEDITDFHSSDDPEKLEAACNECDFVFHLGGVNRPENNEEFISGNIGFTQKLVHSLMNGKKSPVLFSSSVQAEQDNPYGKSKLAAETILREYADETGADVYIYRLPNVFGKWCRPNYNSVIATFCHNIANNIPIHISDENKLMTLAHIDNVTDEMICCMKEGQPSAGELFSIKTTYKATLGEIAALIKSFPGYSGRLSLPDLSDEFTKKLYSTYISFLPTDKLKYGLVSHIDDRGSFTEFLKSDEKGQISVNITKPHIIKGNHWHRSKHEIFLVVQGRGVIRLRGLYEDKTTEIFVSGEKPEPVVIPPGYTHNFENLGEDDMITVIWVNEVFNPSDPDTYRLDV